MVAPADASADGDLEGAERGLLVWEASAICDGLAATDMNGLDCVRRSDDRRTFRSTGEVA